MSTDVTELSPSRLRTAVGAERHRSHRRRRGWVSIGLPDQLQGGDARRTNRPGNPHHVADNVIDHPGRPVCFEIDGVDVGHDGGWSVLVRGMLVEWVPDPDLDPNPIDTNDRDAWRIIVPRQHFRAALSTTVPSGGHSIRRAISDSSVVSDHTPPFAAWAAITWGGSLAVIVGHDGSWPWILTRLAIVGLLLGGLLWTLGHRRWAVASLIIAGLGGCVVGGGIGIPHILKSADLLLATAGALALLAGLALLIAAATTITRQRGVWGRCAGGFAFLILTSLVALIFVPALMATNVPSTTLNLETPATFGLAFQNVTFDTSDGVVLSGWYIPSTNHAAVVIRHGSGSTRSDVLPQAAVLARHGFGVLATDARGHGLSEGRAMDFGWFGDADIGAAVTFLSNRPDVDPARIGVVGMSMGGEEAIGAAASDTRIRVVVAEGATGRTDADTTWLRDVYGVRGTAQQGIEWLRFTLTDLLTSAAKPTSLTDAVEHASSTSFLLIAAGDVPDERHVARALESSASGNVSVWVVPDAGHTGGLVTAPAEWEDKVTAFLDDHLGVLGGG